jgi:hypothetical protein
MKPTAPILSTLLLAVALAGPARAEAPRPIKAVGSVELADVAGDMGPITTSEGEEPPLDVVKLAIAIASDGSRLSVAATLKDAPGKFATTVVELFIDTDNAAATGATLTRGGQRGFEYRAELRLCMSYQDGAASCAGGSSKAAPTRRWGAMELKRFKGRDDFAREDVVSALGFPGEKRSVEVPMKGQVVEASLEYADLKLKPGQQIRILAREAGGNPRDDSGDFPEILLTLK